MFTTYVFLDQFFFICQKLTPSFILDSFTAEVHEPGFINEFYTKQDYKRLKY